MEMQNNFSKKSMVELHRISLEDFKSKERNSIWIILDDIRSRNNVGSVFRTSDAFNIAGILLCGVTPIPPHRDIQKTALGATDSVPWQHFETCQEAIESLKSQGVEIWAVEQTHNSIELNQSATLKNKKIALIFGNEVSGVSEAALAQCHGTLEIPQWGTKHSLNISVSAGIAVWEMVR